MAKMGVRRKIRPFSEPPMTDAMRRALMPGSSLHIPMVSDGNVTSSSYVYLIGLAGSQSRSQTSLNLKLPRTRPASAAIRAPDAKTRFPILGPTRQQTELFLNKNRQERNNVVPLDGASKQLTVGGKLIPGRDVAIFEDKAANALLFDAESQLKSGYPTIATSSMVARRNLVPIPDDNEQQPDKLFFSELVKPIPRNWKVKSANMKTLVPSKHGYHPRSYSPTFQRLIEATERLHVLLEDDSGIYVDKYDDGIYETRSQLNTEVYKKPQSYRTVKSDPPSFKPSVSGSIAPPRDPITAAKKIELQPDVQTFNPFKRNNKDGKSTESDIAEDDFPSERETPQPRRMQEFKVDFKKLESHSELHLFLPHIQDTQSRGVTPDQPSFRATMHDTVLPSVTGDVIHEKNQEDDKFKISRRGNRTETRKKKKRQQLKVTKSGHMEREFRDHLNDVPTQMSLEKDQDQKLSGIHRDDKPLGYHPASMCMFENCPHHEHRKSNRIRQA